MSPHRRRRLLLRLALAAVLLWAASWATWEIALRTIPYPANLARFPRPATIIEDRAGNELAAFVGQQDAWYLPLKSNEISPHLKHAIIAVEDRRFYQHAGVDWRSVFSAAFQDAISLHICRGASTIDMQVHRLREPRRRSWLNKLEQAFRATQLDRMESKDAILTEYVNRAPFGGNLVGAGAASWRYFGKPCIALSLGEAALLAGLPQNPNRLRPDRAPEAARARRHHVLLAMFDAGMITPLAFANADAEPLDAHWRPLPQHQSPNADAALPALIAAAQHHAGEHVITTLDTAMQTATFRATTQTLAQLETSGIDSAAVLVLDVPTAEIRVTVSISSTAPQIDLTKSPRSTGSVIKPFLYAEAFAMGILAPNSTVDDSPRAWAGYTPADYDKTFLGRMTAADALAESRNIPAMVVLSHVGVERGLGTLDDVGIHTPAESPRNYGLSLAIGGADAAPLEVAEAYATLARGGEHITAHFLPTNQHDATRVFPENVCWQTLSCLDAPDRTECVAGALPAANLRAAWKTGTSSGLRDAWCAAVTPRLAIVVWLGNSTGRGASALVGQEAAAPLALQLLGALDHGGEKKFPAPSRQQNPTRDFAQNSRLTIVTPAPATEIFLDNTTSADQRIVLKSAGGSGTQRWWFANGTLIGSTSSGEPLLWSPASGNYDLRVTDETGQASRESLRIQ